MATLRCILLDELWNLVQKCWQKEPASRPTISGVLGEVRPNPFETRAYLIILQLELGPYVELSTQQERQWNRVLVGWPLAGAYFSLGFYLIMYLIILFAFSSGVCRSWSCTTIFVRHRIYMHTLYLSLTGRQVDNEVKLCGLNRDTLPHHIGSTPPWKANIVSLNAIKISENH